MSETLTITAQSKKDKYIEILPQIYSLVEYESNQVANMANVVAVLKEVFDFFWVGFYLVDGDQLVLAPFQGPIACTRIKKGKGVCGYVFEKGKSVVVADVETFPGHIACSSASRSEIVVPILKNGCVVGVLDVDSQYLNHFDSTDEKYLMQMCNELAKMIF